MSINANNGKVSFAKANPKAPVNAAPKITAPAPAPSPAPAIHGEGDFNIPLGGGERPPIIEPCVTHGIIVGVYDIGTVEGKNYTTQEIEHKHKLLVLWELPDIRLESEDENGDTVSIPRTQKQKYNWTFGPRSSLRRDVQAVFGKAMSNDDAKAFKMTDLLGINAQVQLITGEYNGTPYNSVKSVMGLMKGTPKRTAESPLSYFTFSSIPAGVVPDESLFPEVMPNWIKRIIMTSPEWAQLGGQPPVDAEQQAYGG
jgi:hypothetical protein